MDDRRTGIISIFLAEIPPAGNAKGKPHQVNTYLRDGQRAV